MFYCRLHRHGLRALNVGGHGDCSFTTITFQLHSHANYHSEIRTTGIQYLREETNKKPLTPGVVNPYCSVKCLSAQCSLHFFLSESKVKQSIVYIAISQCFHSILTILSVGPNHLGSYLIKSSVTTIVSPAEKHPYSPPILSTRRLWNLAIHRKTSVCGCQAILPRTNN